MYDGKVEKESERVTDNVLKHLQVVIITLFCSRRCFKAPAQVNDKTLTQSSSSIFSSDDGVTHFCNYSPSEEIKWNLRAQQNLKGFVSFPQFHIECIRI